MRGLQARPEQPFSGPGPLEPAKKYNSFHFETDTRVIFPTHDAQSCACFALKLTEWKRSCARWHNDKESPKYHPEGLVPAISKVFREKTSQLLENVDIRNRISQRTYFLPLQPMFNKLQVWKFHGGDPQLFPSLSSAFRLPFYCGDFIDVWKYEGVGATLLLSLPPRFPKSAFLEEHECGAHALFIELDVFNFRRIDFSFLFLHTGCILFLPFQKSNNPEPKKKM